MIKEIIEKKLVEIYFQPIVSIRTKNIYAFEALTRCIYKGQNIPPDKLFNLAKQENLLFQLDVMTRNIAIERFNTYFRENNELLLFLNFESSLIDNFKLTEQTNSFIETIIRLKIPFKNFMLEIKEDEILNTKALKNFCQIYKDLGFSIALDDFGTGSSTFDRINLIKPDLIKIDKSLFVDIKNNLINKEIVRAISKMSHNLGIRVLAEGVEDEDAICISMHSSVNLFQGYYFSKAEYNINNSEEEKIVSKIIDMGKLFKSKTIESINKKRSSINKYDVIANNIVDNIEQIDSSYSLMQNQFFKYNDIEAIYLIDTNTSKQIHDTIIIDNINDRFKPSKHGDEHYLKEYYYITLESKHGIFLSRKYISYASGNICKTFAKKFKNKNDNYILCMDIVVQGA